MTVFLQWQWTKQFDLKEFLVMLLNGTVWVLHNKKHFHGMFSTYSSLICSCIIWHIFTWTNKNLNIVDAFWPMTVASHLIYSWKNSLTSHWLVDTQSRNFCQKMKVGLMVFFQYLNHLKQLWDLTSEKWLQWRLVSDLTNVWSWHSCLTLSSRW